jgi:hypothetical protein
MVKMKCELPEGWYYVRLFNGKWKLRYLDEEGNVENENGTPCTNFLKTSLEYKKVWFGKAVKISRLDEEEEE